MSPIAECRCPPGWPQRRHKTCKECGSVITTLTHTGFCSLANEKVSE